MSKYSAYYPKIVEYHDISGFDARVATKLLNEQGIPVSYGVVLKTWRRNNLFPKTSTSRIKNFASQILEAHKLYRGNASWAHDKLKGQGINVSNRTILYTWHENGLEPRGKTTYWDRYSKQILESYKTSEGCAMLAVRQLRAQKIRIAHTMLSTYWKDNGLKPQGAAYLSKKYLPQLIRAYEQFEGNTAQAVKGLRKEGIRISTSWLYDTWMAHGLQAKGYTPLEKKYLGEILSSYKIVDGNASAAARYLRSKGIKIGVWSVLHMWNRHNLVPTGRSSVVEKHLDEILASNKLFQGNLWIATDYLINNGVAVSDESVMTAWYSHNLKPAKGITSVMRKYPDIVTRSNFVAGKNVIKAKKYLDMLGVCRTIGDILDVWAARELELMPSNGFQPANKRPQSIAKILQSHELTNGLVWDALKKLEQEKIHLSGKSLIKFWSVYDLSYDQGISNNARSYFFSRTAKTIGSKETIELLMKAHKESYGCVSIALEFLKKSNARITEHTLKRIWSELGLKAIKGAEVADVPEIRDAIIESYESSEQNFHKAKNKLRKLGYKVSVDTVRKVWSEENLLFRKKRTASHQELSDMLDEESPKIISLDEMLERELVLV